jgi:putative acyl-CoA dehydrogenase
MALALQGSLLVRHGDAAVADAFCASRLDPGTVAGPGVPFGMLPDGLDLAAILSRSQVAAAG